MPKASSINRDFLRAVLKGDKSLMPMTKVRHINMPKFDELSVRNIFPRFKDDVMVMMYLQDEYAKQRYPDREYFFSILNTIHPEYVAKIVKHANKQRHSAEGKQDEKEVVQVSKEWWDKLKEMPYFSSKFMF